MNLIHITDLHFDTTIKLPELLRLVDSDVINDINPENTYLILTGDIATKGVEDSYSFAKVFIEKVFIQNNKIKPKKIILCPGNHDYSNGSLEAFNGFSKQIRDDSTFVFNSNDVILEKIDDIFFCSLNSMYRGCRDKISINISELQRKLEKNKQNILEAKHKIALLHHHLIGVEEGDATSVQNAIPLLQLLEEYDFKLVLHGHQHVQLDLNINNMQIMSGRSLLSQSVFLGNGFNKISYDVSSNKFVKHSYELSRDTSVVGQLSLKAV